MTNTLGLLLVFTVSGGPMEHSARPDSLMGMAEESEMQQFVNSVLERVDLHNNVPVVVDPKATGCAYAATTRDGQQYIGVDPACVGPLRQGPGYNWRAAGILCHEVGHLLGGHTLNGTSSHREETEADEWSGWMLFQLGATLQQALAMPASMSLEGSKTHPGRIVRLESVKRGWKRAKDAFAGGGGASSTTVPTSDTPTCGYPPCVTWWEKLMKTSLPWQRTGKVQ
jgi:hypothetical protein